MTSHIARLTSLLLCLLILNACGSKRRASVEPLPTPPIATDPAPYVPQPWVAPLGDSIRHEMRAVWLTTAYALDWPKAKADTPNGIRRQKEELDRILDRLKQDGYNTIFFQVRQSGSVSYPSKYEPYSRVFTSDGSAPAYDPLAYAVEACHKRGLGIHAWLVSYPITSPKNRPHPLLSSMPRAVILHKGSRHLDPGMPEARTYLSNIVEEVVTRYAVDGIHLDYFRYPEEAAKFNDAASYAQYGQGLPKAVWRRANLTEQLRQLRSVLLKHRPEVQLSVAPLGKYRKIADLGRAHGWTAYEDVFQDVETWAKEGLVDFVAPMMYYKDLLYEPFLKDWMQTVGRYVPVIPGLAPYRMVEDSWSADVIIEQVRLARAHGAAGVAMFREEHIGAKHPELRTKLQREFAHTALPIVVRKWMTTAPSAPHSLRLQEVEGKLNLSWAYNGDDAGISYRVWATVWKQGVGRESYIVVQNLKSRFCSLRLNDFSQVDCIELGVEAVNPYGRSTPAPQAVEYNIKAHQALQIPKH